MSRVRRQRRESPGPASSGGVLRRAPASARVEDGGTPAHGFGGVSVAARTQMEAASSRPLEEPVRRDLERGFGTSLKDVRVATDERAAAAADALQARAFTVGPSIWFNRGEYQPRSSEGRRLLAHEVAHSLQQRGGPSGPQAKLTVGRSDDPAEAAADRAADQVASGGRAAVQPGGAGVVRRQKKRTCTAGPLDASDTSVVTCDDGAEYDATLTTTEKKTSPWTVSATPGLDTTNVWVEVKVCKGHDEVTITPNVNLPAAVQKSIGNVLAGKGVFTGVTITPSTTITWNRAFTATGGPDIDVQSGNVTGGSGQLCYDTGKVKICVSGGGSTRPKGWHVGASVGSSTRGKPPDCTSKKYVTDVTCKTVTRTKAIPPVEPDDVQAYVFFDYMKAGAPISPTPVLQRGSKAVSDKTLQKLAEDGYRAIAVSGFTSPEGPRAKLKGRKFQGNDQLSLDRAKSAVDWLKQQVGNAMGDPATVTGESELYSPPDVKGREVEGDPLTKAAVTGFEGGDPLKGLADPKLAQWPPAEQRGELYPLLRRAVIQLHKEGKAGKESERKPGPSGACPEDVRKAVLLHKK